MPPKRKPTKRNTNTTTRLQEVLEFLRPKSKTAAPIRSPPPPLSVSDTSPRIYPFATPSPAPQPRRPLRRNNAIPRQRAVSPPPPREDSPSPAPPSELPDPSPEPRDVSMEKYLLFIEVCVDGQPMIRRTLMTTRGTWKLQPFLAESIKIIAQRSERSDELIHWEHGIAELRHKALKRPGDFLRNDVYDDHEWRAVEDVVRDWMLADLKEIRVDLCLRFNLSPAAQDPPPQITPAPIATAVPRVLLIALQQLTFRLLDKQQLKSTSTRWKLVTPISLLRITFIKSSPPIAASSSPVRILLLLAWSSIRNIFASPPRT